MNADPPGIDGCHIETLDALPRVIKCLLYRRGTNEPRTRIILRGKGGVSGASHVDSVAAIHRLGRTFSHFLTDYDVILTRKLTRETPRIGELDAFDESLNLATLIEHFHSYPPFTALFNASGQPAMSVPLYWTPAGLPIGSHFAGRFGEESTLFSLAAQLERAQPWAGRVPAINATGIHRWLSAIISAGTRSILTRIKADQSTPTK